MEDSARTHFDSPAKRRLLHLGTTASAALCASLFSSHAMAQDGGLEEIFVTARKVVESLQETPIAVSAFSGAALEARQILSSDDLSKVTPGLTFDGVAPSSGSNSAGQIFIRGVGQTDFTGVTDPGVGVYVDGVYMARSIGSVLDFVDIESIEVLRGPQGTLFGRNTIGGAILINSARPSFDEFEGRVQATYGSYDQFFVTGHVNVPITDTLATRFSANRRSRDGYVTRVADLVDTGNDDTFGFRGSLLWEPSQDVSVYLVADYTNEDENGAPAVTLDVNEAAPFAFFPNIAEPTCPVMSPGNTATNGNTNCANSASFLGPFTSGGTFDQVSELEAWGVSGEIVWDIGENISLKSITSYRTFDMFSSRDADNTPFLIFQTQDTFEQEQFSQELVASYTGFDDRLTWIAGLYYFNEDGTNENPVDLPVGSLLSGGDFKNTAIAAFTEATFDVTEKLALTFGIRYSEDDKEFTPLSIATGSGLPALVGSFLPPAYAAPGGIAIPIGTQFVDGSTAEATFDDVSIRAIASYQWTPEIQTYVSFSQGYKSGGFDQRYAGTQEEPALAEGGDDNNLNNPISGFEPEELTTYEIGFKGDLFDSRMRLNIAAYFSEYKDIQLIVRETFNPITFNGGDAEIMGFEVETTILPADGWTIIGSLAYIDGEYTRIDGSVAGITLDNKLVNTSPWQTSLFVAYEAETPWGTITPQMDWSYSGAQFNNAINTPQLRQDPFHLVNASLSWQSENERYKLTAAVQNLTDSEYLITGNSAFETAAAYVEGIFGRPRTYNITGEVRF